MKSKIQQTAQLHHLAIIVLFLIGYSLYSPTISSAQQSAPRTRSTVTDSVPKPTLDRLDLNTASNQITVYFTPAKKVANLYEPAKTIIFRCNASGDECIEIASLPISATSYLDASSEADPTQGPVSYKIATEASNGKRSPMTNRHATIYLTLTYDPCSDAVQLDWTHYEGWGSKFKRFVIYRSNSTPLSETNNIDWKNRSETSFIDEGVEHNRRYYYAVRVEREVPGKDDEYSWSNTVYVDTRKSKAPGRMEIDSIISLEASNRISFQIDPASDVEFFELIRRDDPTQGKMQWIQIDRFTDKTKTYAIDDIDGTNTSGRPRFYHLRAIDACDAEVAESPILNSTVVRAANRKDKNEIHWNELKIKPDTRAEYRLSRICKKDGQLVTEEITVKQSGEPLEFYDDISEFEGKNFTSRFCYFVEAWELVKGRRGRYSRSNTSCCHIQPPIILPNAISPLERTATNKRSRNEFKPVDNDETNYRIVIYDRSGQVIFDQKDQPWTGQRKDGSFVPEGAYIYRVTVYTEGYTPRVATGSVMVVYPVKK